MLLGLNKAQLKFAYQVLYLLMGHKKSEIGWNISCDGAHIEDRPTHDGIGSFNGSIYKKVL